MSTKLPVSALKNCKLRLSLVLNQSEFEGVFNVTHAMAVFRVDLNSSLEENYN